LPTGKKEYMNRCNKAIANKWESFDSVQSIPEKDFNPNTIDINGVEGVVFRKGCERIKKFFEQKNIKTIPVNKHGDPDQVPIPKLGSDSTLTQLPQSTFPPKSIFRNPESEIISVTSSHKETASLYRTKAVERFDYQSAFSGILPLPKAPVPYSPLFTPQVHSLVYHRRMVIVIGIRITGIERLYNSMACLMSLGDQGINKARYKIVVVEESESAIIPRELTSICDEYYHLYSNTLYNRSRAFNYGVEMSGCTDDDILCLSDSDLLFDRNFVARYISSIAPFRSVIIPYNNIYKIPKEDSIKAISARLSSDKDFDTKDFNGKEISNLVGGVTLISPAAYNDIGGFDDEFVGWGCEDIDFILSAMKKFSVWRDAGTIPHLYHAQEDKGLVLGNNVLHLMNKHPEFTGEWP